MVTKTDLLAQNWLQEISRAGGGWGQLGSMLDSTKLDELALSPPQPSLESAMWKGQEYIAFPKHYSPRRMVSALDG